MRVRGAMGRMVDKMTKAEKSDLLSTLGRIEEGVYNATGRLSEPQSRVELEDIRIVAGGRRSAPNVASLKAPEPILNDNIFVIEREMPSNVVPLHKNMETKISAKNKAENKPIKAFPAEFYSYFEFVDNKEEAV